MIGNLGAGEIIILLIIIIPIAFIVLSRITKKQKQTKVKRVKKNTV